ncbi:MAG: hypothetical protein JWO33_2926 [Caulobacteraceae bacterium]|nr:hypothetical protein [Caulobacteraceae bacterium]
MPASQTSEPILPAEERAERHGQVLKDLAAIGMNLARLVESRAVAAAQADPAAPLGEVALQFSRIARAVRQTLALEAHLAEENAALADDEHRDRSDARWVEGRRRREAAGEIVERLIETEAGPDKAEALEMERYDWLDAHQRDDLDFADRPVGEIVAGICRDLGLSIDFAKFFDADWGLEAAAVLVPGHAPPRRPAPRAGAANDVAAAHPP